MIAPAQDAAIAVRAFLSSGTAEQKLKRPDSHRVMLDIGPSDYALIIDTETMTDAAQQLRFGCYQLRFKGQLEEVGIFYDPESLSSTEQDLLTDYAGCQGAHLMTYEAFVDEIFYGVGYELGATIVGLNLPFDVSRLAIKHSTARSRIMRDGFTFQLSRDLKWPNVQIKHLSRRAAFIRFAGKRGQTTGRGMRRRDLKVPDKRGYFVDIRTLAAALTGRGFSLGQLAEFLELRERKLQTDEHGQQLTEAYVEYAMQDVQTTWACFEALRTRYDQHGLFRSVIDMRSEIKARMKLSSGPERSRFDTEQLGLKILANSTSYGIYVELNTEQMPQRMTANCHGVDGTSKTIMIDKVETPGGFFHPLLGTLIAGAARMMLAIAERLVLDAGLDWVFCDTDSIAIAKPEGQDDQNFLQAVDGVRSWFAPLNPYKEKGTLLKLEDQNYSAKSTGEIEPLCAYAVSAKRYALFNIRGDGQPVLRKATGHGLGHLLGPDLYSEPAVEDDTQELAGVGVPAWAAKYWLLLILAALDGRPNQVDTSDIRGFQQPAVSRYAATSPRLLGWFKRYNRKKPYRKQVRPFNFLLVFQAEADLVSIVKPGDLAVAKSGAERKRGRFKTAKASADLPKAVAPFDADRLKAAEGCFDRESGKRLSPKRLRTYAQALRRYHIHPEAKFLKGQYVDRGRTERRHLNATSIIRIGKEANRWEEQSYLGLDPEAQLEFGLVGSDQKRLLNIARQGAKAVGIGKLATIAGWSRRHLAEILTGRKALRDPDMAQLAEVARRLTEQLLPPEEALDRLRQHCKRYGLRITAAQLKIDSGHLSRILSKKRKLPERLAKQLAIMPSTSLGGGEAPYYPSGCFGASTSGCFAPNAVVAGTKSSTR